MQKLYKLLHKSILTKQYDDQKNKLLYLLYFDHQFLKLKEYIMYINNFFLNYTQIKQMLSAKTQTSTDLPSAGRRKAR